MKYHDCFSVWYYIISSIEHLWTLGITNGFLFSQVSSFLPHEYNNQDGDNKLTENHTIKIISHKNKKNT